MDAEITISLKIENAYADGTQITTYATDVQMPAPPVGGEQDAEQWDTWKYEHLYAFTGTGRTDGDSWYDVTVTACSDPALVGRTFEFGY